MAHLVAKDVFRKLGDKIDGLQLRTPWNENLRKILEELYTREEAELILKLPYSLSTLERLETATGIERTRLRKLLEGLCRKGLVMDIHVNGAYHYAVAPMVIGIFEFTMMRTKGDANPKKWAELFQRYMDSGFYGANSSDTSQLSVMRSLPHEDTVLPEQYTEVLDYEKATHLVGEADRFSIAVCPCRHEKHHLGTRNPKCDTPLESCLSFGYAADYLIRNELAREASKEEVLALMEQSKERGLVFNADNVQQNATFICQCCGCCCAALRGISQFGYPGTIVTSSFIPRIDHAECNGCGKCKKACPINAVSLRRLAKPQGKKKVEPEIDEEVCLGCGVCALKCETESLKLVKREQRVLHPETTFHRVLLTCVETGNLQNQLFDDPNKVSHQFMRGFLGGFLRLSPVKRALVSDTLRSRFLSAMEVGIKAQGKGFIASM